MMGFEMDRQEEGSGVNQIGVNTQEGGWNDSHEQLNYSQAKSMFSEISEKNMDQNSLAIVKALEEKLKLIARLDSEEDQLNKRMQDSQRHFMQYQHNSNAGNDIHSNLLENHSLVNSYVVPTFPQLEEMKSSQRQQYNSEQSPVPSRINTNQFTFKPDRLTFSQREAMKCTFHPIINKNSEKIAKRAQAEKNQTPQYLYQDFFLRKQKEKEKKLQQLQELKANTEKPKINRNSLRIVLNKIDKVLSFIIESVQEEDNISYDNLGFLYSQLGLFRALEFQKDQNQTQLFLSDRKKVDLHRLQAEMKFHEQSYRILTLNSEQHQGVSKKLIFDTLIVLYEKQTSIQRQEAILKDVIFNSLRLDIHNPTEEDKEAILKSYLTESTLPQHSKLKREGSRGERGVGVFQAFHSLLNAIFYFQNLMKEGI